MRQEILMFLASLCLINASADETVVTKADEPNLLLVSIATEATDGFKRFERSLKAYDYKYEVFGLGQEWKGGNIKLHAGGGQKVNFLVKGLEKYKDDQKKVVIFTDSYDVIVTQKPSILLEKFKAFDAKIVFGAEDFCWPNPELEDEYPAVEPHQKRFLNSGGFIGIASDIYSIITNSKLQDDDDDQLFYTKIFLDKELREKHKIKLDVNSEIFQNLNGASHEISLISIDQIEVNVYNNVTKTVPSIIHGNGGAKSVLNRLGNYIGKAFSASEGCITCIEDIIKLNPEKSDEWPDVIIAIFIEHPTPFLREFLKKIAELNYPKKRITVLIHNNVNYHSKEVDTFFNDPKNDYASIKYIAPEDDSPEHEARTEALEECKRTKCSYLFAIDSTAHLDNSDTLKLLIEQNRPVLSPVMVRKESTWSNVWGAISEKGFYQRSEDYLDIIKRDRLGVWNVPFVSEAVLLNGTLIQNIPISYEDSYLDAVLQFASNLREKDIFMYGTNMDYFGHLVNPDGYNTTLIRPEMYEIFNNLEDWANRYLHPEFYDYLNGKSEILQPCTDVYWFPIVSEEFCDDMITMMEHFGEWSGGKNNNYDPRLPGGYENVPTVDIHMRQVGWDKHWLYFLRKFMQLMQRKIYLGYFHDPPEALLSFVVRYRPGEQDHLTPHHDASTYTSNIALNTINQDFQGGGVRFVRYNCSILDTKKGWTMIHPGRLTHYHEGLKVSNGTRYIMVTFIDP